jgi:hypothetical protein
MVVVTGVSSEAPEVPVSGQLVDEDGCPQHDGHHCRPPSPPCELPAAWWINRAAPDDEGRDHAQESPYGQDQGRRPDRQVLLGGERHDRCGEWQQT